MPPCGVIMNPLPALSWWIFTTLAYQGGGQGGDGVNGVSCHYVLQPELNGNEMKSRRLIGNTRKRG